jgi:hypothetical protein
MYRWRLARYQRVTFEHRTSNVQHRTSKDGFAALSQSINRQSTLFDVGRSMFDVGRSDLFTCYRLGPLPHRTPITASGNTVLFRMPSPGALQSCIKWAGRWSPGSSFWSSPEPHGARGSPR